eukprot:g5590.t1
MKASATTSVLLGLLSRSAVATEPVKAQAEIPVGDVTFRVSRFTDGRSTPYRIYFWDKHITGSSYRFGQDGHLEYFKAGDEVYYDRTEKDNGLLTYSHKGAKDSGRSHEDKMPMMDQGVFTCDDCVADLAAVCEAGLPAFCDNVDETRLGQAGAYSVGVLCHSAGALCSTLQDGCDAICINELEQAPTCSNGFVGFEASNGACCDAGCGRCGGTGCSTFGQELGLDNHDCCASEIVDFGKPCSEAGKAPCFIEDDGSDDTVSSDDDTTSTCDNDFMGIEASNGACCAAGCGRCGGVGCSTFGKELGLDKHDCCATEIVDFGKPCSETGHAPCFVDSDDDLRGVIMGSSDDDTRAMCVRSSLTAEDLEGLDVYDFDMYVEPACMTPEHLPNGCNFMGLGQGCRGCYETCEGALYYIKMHKEEINLKGEDVIINFCPDSGVRSIDDCRE